jgi:O-succinylbenzoic acid--CoA ligase
VNPQKAASGRHHREVLPVAVDGADGLPLLPLLRAALSGDGPAVAPHARGTSLPPAAAAPLGADEDDPADPVAAVVSTTGSTGTAKHVLLPAASLLASAAATHDHLGGAGRWVLAVPAHTVAGVQVLVRSLVAGTTPVVCDLAEGFRVPGFAAATEELLAGRPGRRYTSLVPTQLLRLLDDAAGVEALRTYDAVLVGGAALDPAVRERAEAAGARVVSTYGMTETCGGCVYDGHPLPGVQVDVEPDGRVVVSGAVVARGYRGVAAPSPGREGFVAADGRRSFRTADRAEWRDGTLVVLGRTDDVVVSGGVNVSLDAVVRAVTGLPGVTAALAVGLPDPRWGHVVGLLLETPDAQGTVDTTGDLGPDDDLVRETVRSTCGRASVPRVVLRVAGIPLTGVGKPDRQAAARLLADGVDGAPDAASGHHVLSPTAAAEEPTT